MPEPVPYARQRTVWEPVILASVFMSLLAVSLVMLISQIGDPRPVRLAGLTFDRMSTVFTLLVAGIGAVTFHFSLRYLDGNPNQKRFLRLLTFTVCSAYGLMCSTHLAAVFVAWTLTGLGLHGLLTIFSDRPEAIRPARKKFVISRLGDLALIAAFGLIWTNTGTLDLNEFLVRASTELGSQSLSWIAFLIAFAALTKSAQFPFHSWLPETMESPTPVSALMHAGIINAGGVLLIRFAPVIVRVPEVLVLLSVIGTISLTLGLLAMWAQVKIKRVLAWSTVSQMGFMMVQCGLGAFPAAAIHIVGHGCYKAWSFLRSGEVPPASAVPVSPWQALGLATIGFLVAIPCLVVASVVTGYSPLHSPGELALSAIVALSIGQLWVAMLGRPSPGTNAMLVRSVGALAATVITSIGAFGLYSGIAIYLSPVIGELSTGSGVLIWIAAMIPVVAMVILTVIHALLPVITQTKMGRNLHIHAIQGFYFGTIADNAIDRLFGRPRFFKPGVHHV